MSEDIKTPDSQVDVDEMKKTDAEQDNLDQVEGIEATASDAARPEGAVLEDDLAEANDNHDDDERTDNASEPAGEEADTDEQIAPGKEDGQQDSTPLDLDGVPVLDDVSATVSDTENIPRFLTRDQYEQVGDDPDPLPTGFEVIDGGISATGGAQTPTVPDEESVPKEALPAKPEDGAAQAVAKAGAAIADAAASVGSMLSQGMGAVREVSAARRAHSEARDHLDELSQVIEENEDELTHRRDVEANYAQIVAEQTARQASCLESVRAAVAAQQAIAKTIDDLKQSLSAMKDADKATEKRLKSALDAAESQEASAREGANRLVRRVTDAQRGLESAKADRETNLAAARKAVESAQARLNALREEFAEIQRNPSANSAAYSVRGTELENDISDAAEQLRTAQEQLPRLTAELDQSIADAEAVVTEANKPIEEARSSFRDVSNATAEARDALDAARKDAETRQKELRSQINEQEKALKNQQKAQQEAQDDVDNAAEILADANDIHAHPEITQQLAARIDSDKQYQAQQMQQVESLAATEKNVREQTRTSRLKFVGIVAAIVVAVALLIFCWTTFMK
ncbi:MAG: hypothetical protein UD455_06740 [Collinsella bouchesdurhonensis]|nr:hypothetical protein [Collinsella bouchesdurhonensis]